MFDEIYYPVMWVFFEAENTNYLWCTPTIFGAIRLWIPWLEVMFFENFLPQQLIYWSHRIIIEKNKKNSPRSRELVYLPSHEYHTRMWFQIWFIFTPKFGGKMNPFWGSYFSDGLVQPPPSIKINEIHVDLPVPPMGATHGMFGTVHDFSGRKLW